MPSDTQCVGGNVLLRAGGERRVHAADLKEDGGHVGNGHLHDVPL